MARHDQSPRRGPQHDTVSVHPRRGVVGSRRKSYLQPAAALAIGSRAQDEQPRRLPGHDRATALALPSRPRTPQRRAREQLGPPRHARGRPPHAGGAGRLRTTMRRSQRGRRGKRARGDERTQNGESTGDPMRTSKLHAFRLSQSAAQRGHARRGRSSFMRPTTLGAQRRTRQQSRRGQLSDHRCRQRHEFELLQPDRRGGSARIKPLLGEPVHERGVVGDVRLPYDPAGEEAGPRLADDGVAQDVSNVVSGSRPARTGTSSSTPDSE